MTKLISFNDALKAAGGKDCSILLGNGFSSRYFSYRSLLDKADLTADDPVRVLFDRLKTVDFERVVKALEGAAEVELAYGNGDHAKQLIGDAVAFVRSSYMPFAVRTRRIEKKSRT